VTETVVIRVKPGSRKGPLVEASADGALTIYVREPAVELVSGATSRVKRFRVTR
jgi:uncharacterized protein YggU (UPF0235/DUF167 family)